MFAPRHFGGGAGSGKKQRKQGPTTVLGEMVHALDLAWSVFTSAFKLCIGLSLACIRDVYSQCMFRACMKPPAVQIKPSSALHVYFTRQPESNSPRVYLHRFCIFALCETYMRFLSDHALSLLVINRDACSFDPSTLLDLSSATCCSRVMCAVLSVLQRSAQPDLASQKAPTRDHPSFVACEHRLVGREDHQIARR